MPFIHVILNCFGSCAAVGINYSYQHVCHSSAAECIFIYFFFTARLWCVSTYMVMVVGVGEMIASFSIIL